MAETIIIVDFGGQYNQLIARRVRENNVYSEVVPYGKALAEIKAKQPKGIIFTGGPASVYEEGAPTIDPEVFRLGIPVLGICYGAQLMAYLLGGKVVPPVAREYGRVPVKTNGGLMGSIVSQGNSWMSHGDQIETIPEGFVVTATSETCPVAAMENAAAKLYAVQFHPEVQHTEFGKELLHAFLYDVCGCSGDWTSAGFVERTVAAVRAEVGEERRVLCALSGGVDSTVAAVINYMAGHNGFTLQDMISYDRKHNEDNGENNRDGTEYNDSWNCGVEGKTKSKRVLELRERQRKNAILLLLLSQGVPMIMAGDEMCRTQNGNNNAYCQDNSISWMNWKRKETEEEFFQFVKEMIAFRKKHPVFHQQEELRGMDYLSCGYPDFSFHGEKAWYADMEVSSRQFGVMYYGQYATDRSFYVAYNLHWEKHSFALPALPKGIEWKVAVDTSKKKSILGEGREVQLDVYKRQISISTDMIT